MVKKEIDRDILRVRDMTVKLGDKLILNNVDLDVKKGEMLGVVGVSGIGKTTLLNSIIGFCPLLKGDVSYYSYNVKDYISALNNLGGFRRLFGFSAQNPSYYPELSVMENLGYFASLYDMPEDVKKKNINRAIKLVELKDDCNKYAKNLSGGMQKRLDIACAIVHNPKILILDEPTADVDPLLRIQLWNLMEDINKSGTTVIVSSHFLSELEYTCDRTALLHEKNIKFIGSPQEFRDMHANVKEIHITTKDGRYDLILKRVVSIPFLEVKHVFKRKGKIVLHSRKDLKIIKGAVSRLMKKEANISDVEIISPSFDMLFKLFIKK